MTSLAKQDCFEDVQHDFVAVRNTKTTSVRKSKNTKGKGRYVPPPETPLSQLLQQKFDLLQGSAFLQSCLDILQNTFDATARKRCRRCMCFGLGSLRHSPKSLLQLALFQLLLRSGGFQSEREEEEWSPPILIDPEFAPEDEKFLEGLGYEVQTYEDSHLDATDITFLYMPHCPRSLYEKLLDRNKDRLHSILLLSNDLSLYAEREIRSEELAKIPYLVRLGKNFKIGTLPDFEDRPDAFNDMAWLSWNADKDREHTKTASQDVNNIFQAIEKLGIQE